jgi:hypothetical protein
MYFNNYIQIALYVPQVLILIALIFFSPKTNYFKSVKLYFGLLFLLTIIGISIGTYIGLKLDKGSHQMKEDITKLITLVFFIGLPFFLNGLSLSNRNLIFKVFNGFAFIYTLLVFPNMFLTLEDSSIYPGNLFGRTTVNLTIISSWAFYSLSIYFASKNKLFLTWSFICYIAVVASLAKWNAIAIVFYPLLAYLILIMYNDRLGVKMRRVMKYPFWGMSVLIILNFSTLAEPLARNLGYGSFDDYLDSRVFGDSNNRANLVQTIEFSEDKGIKDGARFVMWVDMLTRTKENPWFGVGIGSRALENLGLKVEDHNIFVTHVSRYGVPIFLLWCILIFKLFKLQYNNLVTNKLLAPLKYLYFIILLNFFFQASVGNIWGQLLVALFIGTAIGSIISTGTEYGNSIKQKI